MNVSGEPLSPIQEEPEYMEDEKYQLNRNKLNFFTPQVESKNFSNVGLFQIRKRADNTRQIVCNSKLELKDVDTTN